MPRGTQTLAQVLCLHTPILQSIKQQHHFGEYSVSYTHLDRTDLFKDQYYSVAMMENDTERQNGTMEVQEYGLTIVYKYIVPALFGMTTVTGMIGNILVILVITTQRKMQTVVNILLLNLAIADISFLIICPPFTAFAFAVDTWTLGNVACKVFHYLLNVTVYVTIYTLVTISLVRSDHGYYLYQ